ncbi:MAG: Cell cycle response regulator CtrA [Calditrichaeota bacterium]|nr:Cell cycle response regulator CtrA [Calditrichota bacterium]
MSDTPTAGDSSQLSILLIDDEMSILETSTMMLKLLGYDVTGVKSSSEALEIVREKTGFDLVLTDLDMPGIDGRELAKRVREAGVTAPVVVISGYALDEDEWRGDFDGMLTKPFRVQDLKSKVEELIRR